VFLHSKLITTVLLEKSKINDDTKRDRRKKIHIVDGSGML